MDFKTQLRKHAEFCKTRDIGKTASKLFVESADCIEALEQSVDYYFKLSAENQDLYLREEIKNKVLTEKVESLETELNGRITDLLFETEEKNFWKERALAAEAKLEETPSDENVNTQLNYSRASNTVLTNTIEQLENNLSTAISALEQVKIDLFEAEDKFHVLSFYISDKQSYNCAVSRVKWMNDANKRINAILVDIREN